MSFISNSQTATTPDAWYEAESVRASLTRMKSVNCAESASDRRCLVTEESGQKLGGFPLRVAYVRGLKRQADADIFLEADS